MFCPKCGGQVPEDTKFCPKCGSNISISQQNINNQTNNVVQPYYNQQYSQSYPQYNYQINQKPNNTRKILIGIIVGLVFVFVLILISSGNSGGYYFSPAGEEPEGGTTTGGKRGKYDTVVVFDNVYTGVEINTKSDVDKLIVKDSVEQKKECPSEIQKYENELIDKYGITAVNLCELDTNFAKELIKVFDKIYKEYPSARGYLTNITLTNNSADRSYIAAFQPVFLFATSDTISEFPAAFKTQIFLNTGYFFNQSKLKRSVESGSASGHFPKNATMYSPVAHELGHYLSFLALIKNYDYENVKFVDSLDYNTLVLIMNDFSEGNFSLKMITEAYNNYKRDTGKNIELDAWRGTISQYALAKDNSGKYIYDETIAEAFHDVYLNGDKAVDASKYVVAILKQKLGD